MTRLIHVELILRFFHIFVIGLLVLWVLGNTCHWRLSLVCVEVLKIRHVGGLELATLRHGAARVRIYRSNSLILLSVPILV